MAILERLTIVYYTYLPVECRYLISEMYSKFMDRFCLINHVDLGEPDLRHEYEFIDF